MQEPTFLTRLVCGWAELAFTQVGFWTLNSTSSSFMSDQRDMDVVTSRLHRLGFDNMCGYLCGGMSEWQEAGKPFSSVDTMSVSELKSRLDSGEVALLDVREPNEWKEDGIVEGATRIFFADLPEKTGSLPKDKPIAVTCSVGNRSSIAVSMLERAGIRNVSNVLGGMTAWTNLGYPVKRTFSGCLFFFFFNHCLCHSAKLILRLQQFLNKAELAFVDVAVL